MRPPPIRGHDRKAWTVGSKRVTVAEDRFDACGAEAAAPNGGWRPPYSKKRRARCNRLVGHTGAHREYRLRDFELMAEFVEVYANPRAIHA